MALDTSIFCSKLARPPAAGLNSGVRGCTAVTSQTKSSLGRALRCFSHATVLMLEQWLFLFRCHSFFWMLGRLLAAVLL